ncbi:MAG: hypothetical protein E6G58_01140 [Actinobacteria bacterium]|nr:MAG: hypothetical protein E6G58_01140 [Actinomycetota bacterium]
MSADTSRARSLDLLSWSRTYRIEAGGALDFDAFPFQRELYEAFGDPGIRRVAVMKAAQCGISAAGVSLALYAADAWGANVLYVLPGFVDAHDFSDTRVAPTIRASAYLRSRVRSTDNKGLKQIGGAFVYFRGSGSEAQAQSVPADVLILDEFDRLDRRQLPSLRRRLGAPASLKLERAFSNPTYPESGIHDRFLSSDQRRWLVRCPRCRTERPLSWDGSTDHVVDEERAALACGRCRRPLPAGAIAAGRWLPERPEVAPRGYHISRLMLPGQDISELLDEHRAGDEEGLQAHHNLDLGLPYSPRGGSLDRELVYACRRDYETPDSYDGPDWVTAGVDVGAVLHVRISRWLKSERAVPLHIGEVADFTALGLLWARYDVRLGVIDEPPEERAARAFMDAHRGRVLLCRWSGEDQRDPVVTDEERGLVIARRTGACDRLVAAVIDQRRLHPRDVGAAYLAQMTAPHREVQTRPNGQKVSRYVSTGADHYFFAECYDLLAREARPAPAMASGDDPLTIREQLQRRRRNRG